MWDEILTDMICEIIDRLQLQFNCTSITYKYYADTDMLILSVKFPDMVMKTRYDNFSDHLHKGSATSYDIFKIMSKQLSSNLYKKFCKIYYRQNPNKMVR